MLRSLIIQVMLIATSAVIALFVVKVFDDWHQDTEERRHQPPAQRLGAGS